MNSNKVHRLAEHRTFSTKSAKTRLQNSGQNRWFLTCQDVLSPLIERLHFWDMVGASHATFDQNRLQPLLPFNIASEGHSLFIQ